MANYKTCPVFFFCGKRKLRGILKTMQNDSKRIPQKNDYLSQLKERGETSRVYKKNQMTGLTLAEILEDEKHKSLYMKLAKQYNNEALMRIAKNVAEKKNIANKGAYFMKIYREELKK